MAIYHLSVKCVSRSQGRTATAAAAYRACAKIHDERTGLTFDYTKKGGLTHAEIVLPDGAPAWAQDRERLWNAAEQSEKRINSTVAREFEIALPSELTAEQRRELTRQFAQSLAERHRCAVDVAIHKPGREGDRRNHHAHVLCSTRRLTADGFTEKTRELDDRKTKEVDHWRERWAELTNEALQRANVQSRVDHRTLEAQGIEREPTVHKGPALTALERKGVRLQVEERRAWQEREIVKERLQLAAELGQLAREQQAIEKSIIELSTDISAAKRDRDKGLSMADVRKNAAERWRDHRERQKEAEKDPSKSKGPGKGRDDDDFSM